MEVENLIFNVRRTGDTAARGTDRLSKSLKNLRKSSQDTNKGLGKLLGTFGRMSKLMILRQAIRALIKAMEEGLKNAYAFNSLAGGEMSAALDALKSAAVQTTGALGSAFGEMIANVAPILINLLNLIGRVANAFAQLMAVLGGRSTYTKAIASSEKWADSTAKGAKAAKEWKNQLMGFDEINRLEEPSDSSGGSGGSSPYDGAFELAPAVNKWASELRRITLDWWNSLDLEPITKAWERLTAAVKDFISIVDSALYWAYTNVLLPLAGWTIEKGAPAVVNMLAAAFELLNAVLIKLQPLFLTLWENIIKPFGEWLGTAFLTAVNYVTTALEGLTLKVQSATSFSEFLKSLNGKEALLLGIASAIGTIVTTALMFRTVTSVMHTATAAFTLLTNPIGWVAAAVGALVTVGIALYQNWDDIKRQVGELKKKFEDMISALMSGIGAFGKIITDNCPHVVELINLCVNLFARAKEAVLQLNEVIKAKANANAQRIQEDGSIYLQGLASGGFPDEGQLFVAREAGPELVGTIGNRTAVANNDQIIAGIRQGVFEAVSQAMGNQQGGEVVLKLDGDVLAKGVTKYQRFNAISANI